MSLTTVVHINDEERPYDVYIGRAGKGQDGYFGNPVRKDQPCPVCAKIHGTAGSTLPCFERYFIGRMSRDPEFMRRVEELRGKVLGCFCKPGPCHGDIIARYLNAGGADCAHCGHKATRECCVSEGCRVCDFCWANSEGFFSSCPSYRKSR